jgi:hypothetical protein
MSESKNTSIYWGVLGFLAIVVVGYLVYDYFSRPHSPCETIFEQTSMQFQLKLKQLDTEGGVVLGRQQVQDLTENAQITALNLKTCCIVLNSGNVNPDQFLQCQNAGRNYDAKLDDVIAQVSQFRLAEKAGDSAAVDSLRRKMEETLQEARGITRSLRRQVEELVPDPPPPPPPPVPSPMDDVGPTPSEKPGADMPAIDESHLPVDAPTVELEPEGDPVSAIQISSSPVSNIVVTPFTRFERPEIEEILIVSAGTNLRSFTPVQRASEFGKAMLVEPGSYDIVLDVAGQSMVRLVEGLELGDAQKAIVDPNPLISFILPENLTLDGFPPVAEVFLMDAGTVISGSFYKKQSVNGTGVPIITIAGSYDVYVEPSGGRFFKLIAGIDLGVGRGVSIDIGDYAAVIVYADPKIEGFELKSIYAVEAGTDIKQSHRPVQDANRFGQPLMVPANGSYDIVLEPVNGRRVRVERGVAPTAGRITYIDPNS